MISKEEVLNLAALARLELSEAEVAELQRDISNILEYVGQVSALGATSATAAPAHRNVMRDDAVYDGTLVSGKAEALRAAFPTREGDYNVVRKIIQKDE